MNYTETSIMRAFVQLLEEKPYNKITVKNIVENCRINRNTFYYHFHSIPELVERIIKSFADDIINQYASLDTPLDCILPIFKCCTEYKKAILNIYHSVQRDVFMDNLDRVEMYVVNGYINTITAKIPVSAENKILLIRLYKCIMVGILVDWLDNGMNYDLVKAIVRLSYLFPDTGKQAIFRASNGQNNDGYTVHR
ncbi:MAG: TetR/AcrR family transcriptional regulator [Clostridiales bacterium]|nr:TetR/AcrR family transcriptional regulator [Clostridiales bacterium]